MLQDLGLLGEPSGNKIFLGKKKKKETMLRAGCNSLFCPVYCMGTYKKEHDQSSTRGQTGGWEVKKEKIGAVWSGKSELEGPESLAQCLCFYK